MQAESTFKPESWEIAGRKATKMRDQLERQAGFRAESPAPNSNLQTHVPQPLSTAVKGFSKLRQKMLLGKLTIKELREEGRRF